MNSIIKKQLNKVTKITVPDFNDNTTEIILSKNAQVSDELEIGSYYQIKIENYIINEPENFTLSSNWNGGTKPTDNFMNVEVIQLLGKMTKVHGVGINDELMWEGWLPQKGFKIIKKI